MKKSMGFRIHHLNSQNKIIVENIETGKKSTLKNSSDIVKKINNAKLRLSNV